MINRYLFKTQFSDDFSSFVEMKIQQGNKDTAKKVQSLLRDFETIVVEKSYRKPYIDRYIYECWHSETVSVNDVWTVYWKTCYMINVLKYMCHMGMECYIPPKPKVPSGRFTPRKNLTRFSLRVTVCALKENSTYRMFLLCRLLSGFYIAPLSE